MKKEREIIKKETKIKLEKLDRKAFKLTKALWEEQKSNMYNKNMEKLVLIRKEMEEIRKKEGEHEITR